MVAWCNHLEVVLQPSITVSAAESGLSVNVWGSAFAQSRSAHEGYDELDFTVDLSRPLGEDSPVGISVGYIQYTFPNGASGAKHSEEAYGGLSLDHPLSPAVTFYYDFGLADAWYLALSGSYDVAMGEGEYGPALSLGLSGAMSNYGSKTQFNDVTVSASIGFTAGQFSISPALGYSYAADRINADNSSVWGGVSIGLSPGFE